MEEFFEPPPPPPEPEPRYRTPRWLAPPGGTLPGVVALERVIVRTDRVAICLGRVAAYPEGFQFDIVTMGSPDHDLQLDPMSFHRRLPGRQLAPELLRVGVQFADGGKATNTSDGLAAAGPPSGPVLHGGGGGGGGAAWRQTYWVWPLPPPGPLTVVCEWPVADIPLSRCEIDSGEIIAAARRAQVVFSDEHLPEWPEDEGGGIQVVG